MFALCSRPRARDLLRKPAAPGLRIFYDPIIYLIRVGTPPGEVPGGFAHPTNKIK
jgi:hypothetical protein